MRLISGGSPAVILMAGLQGPVRRPPWRTCPPVKRATEEAVAVVSADVYRPAAIEQLQTLANEVGATFIEFS